MIESGKTGQRAKQYLCRLRKTNQFQRPRPRHQTGARKDVVPADLLR
jgi:hypothetical protein